jgi:hypothetical protein
MGFFSPDSLHERPGQWLAWRQGGCAAKLPPAGLGCRATGKAKGKQQAGRRAWEDELGATTLEPCTHHHALGSGGRGAVWEPEPCDGSPTSNPTYLLRRYRIHCDPLPRALAIGGLVRMQVVVREG